MIRTVFFDCDSTLCAVEGIDLLARRAGVYEQVAPLTHAAMDGELRLDEVYRRRLELIRPDRRSVEWLGREYIEHRVDGAEEVVQELQREGREVHIVSAGVRQAVLMLAEQLGIAPEHVHAVDMRFDAAGNYEGYDEGSPLGRAGGKAEVIRALKLPPGSAVMVGDGVTDLEALETGIPVIGFGGVARRDAMIKGATVYIDEPSLRAVLDAIRSLDQSNSPGDSP